MNRPPRRYLDEQDLRPQDRDSWHLGGALAVLAWLLGSVGLGFALAAWRG